MALVLVFIISALETVAGRFPSPWNTEPDDNRVTTVTWLELGNSKFLCLLTICLWYTVPHVNFPQELIISKMCPSFPVPALTRSTFNPLPANFCCLSNIHPICRSISLGVCPWHLLLVTLIPKHATQFSFHHHTPHAHPTFFLVHICDHWALSHVSDA